VPERKVSGGDDEARHRAQLVHPLHPQAREHAQQGQHQVGREGVEEHERGVRHAQGNERQHRRRDDHAHHQAPRQSAEREAGQELGRAERGHEQVADRALDLGDQQRRGGVGEGVLGHRHHEQARGQEVDEGHAGDVGPPPAEGRC
jgi:hypothetical protein